MDHAFIESKVVPQHDQPKSVPLMLMESKQQRQDQQKEEEPQQPNTSRRKMMILASRVLASCKPNSRAERLAFMQLLDPSA